MFRKREQKAKEKLAALTVKSLKIDDEFDTISGSSTVADAAKKMADKKIPDLCVVDSQNHVLGTVSTFDIVAKVVAQKEPDSTQVTKIMVKLSPVSLDTRVLDAFETMKKDQVEVLPVADAEGKLLGVVTITDVFAAMEFFSSA